MIDVSCGTDSQAMIRAMRALLLEPHLLAADNNLRCPMVNAFLPPHEQCLLHCEILSARTQVPLRKLLPL